MKSKLYMGFAQAADGSGGALVQVVDGKGTRPLNPRSDLRNHSPTGFNWGYGGSGPAQLALAICADALGDDSRAERVYQRFKFKVIGNLPSGKPWTMTQAEVIRMCQVIEAEGPARD